MPESVPIMEGERHLEVGSIGRLMAEASARMAKFYQTNLGKSAVETREGIWGLADESRIERLTAAPPDQVDWWAMNQVAELDPASFYEVWDSLKREARDELDSGHRAAMAVDPLASPWERAQFLAIRQSFRDEWQPRGGIEAALLDSAALAFSKYLEWVTTFDVRVRLRQERVEDHHGDTRKPVRLTDAAARAEAAEMADRFNRILLRTLRALQELRRRPAVVVQNAGQVNVAEQQINVSQRRTE